MVTAGIIMCQAITQANCKRDRTSGSNVMAAAYAGFGAKARDKAARCGS